MKKKILFICFTVLVTLAGWLYIQAAVKQPVSTKKPTCSQQCNPKNQATPATGFFIMDSFSGIL